MLHSFSASKTLLIHLVTVMALFFCGSSLHAQEDSAASEIDGDLPAIEAKAYDLTVIRPSKSGRVYLFQKSADGALPDLGRIFLLRDGLTPVMGFRVLKIYPENSQIAAKKVREYPDHPSLPEGSGYRAYEKIGDILAVPPKSSEDIEDLDDLEKSADVGATQQPDSTTEKPLADELPSTGDSLGSEDEKISSDPPVSSEGFSDDSVENAELDESAFREKGIPDYFPSWVTFEAGLVRHGELPGATYQRGFGVLYGRNFAQNIFRNSADFPDLLTLEGGLYTFRSNGVIDDVTKSYTMLPIKGQLRYTVPTSESFSLYFYGGIIYQYVLSHVNATEEELAAIGVAMPALGMGGLIQFGPNWYIKLNLGLDTLAAGVVLRF